MALRKTVEYLDDIDQTTITEGKGETIRFAVNGVSYEIDLNNKNAKEFHRKLDYYIAHATQITDHKPKAPRTARVKVKRDPSQTKAIREWAIAHGYNVATRGRISADVKAAFHSAR
ncbi:Lsr2 family protein [Rhodococcus sp. DMU2021]|uniref:histone-like nucleoid-structuring protein Lsr2 n=1 Tax=Rhodococcus sp. DMU2021 TaxID=2866997 RepID=UPI001C7DCCF9|nr:Lsr2 family protein [Rhodococcus sp. DMU2021]MBX4170305.1 Lsr2 family protein [Rhodococcus sp. DMU2021]